MRKKIRIPVRSLGSNFGDPSVTSLAEWVASHRGREVDLTSYKLEQSLSSQKNVDIPAVGGAFYCGRWQEAIDGISDGALIKEPDISPHSLIADAALISSLRKDVWFSIPAPHQLNFSDAFYGDADEFLHAIYSCYYRLMREMRDTGSYGHILYCSDIIESELDALAKHRIFFYDILLTSKKLSLLLEYQNQLAIDSDHIHLTFDVLSEYDIKVLIIMNPTHESLQNASQHLDPESIMVGGYCFSNCTKYWDDLMSKVYLYQ